MPNLQNSD